MSLSEGLGCHAQYTQERANDKPCQFCTNSGNKKRKKKYLKNLPLRNRRFFPHFFFPILEALCSAGHCAAV